MAVVRGSTQKLVAIKEATFGTTPATPTMLEMPIVSFGPRSSQTVIKSQQIRSHPFTDKMLLGRFMHELAVEFELQGATHDILFETVFGGNITTKALPFADTIKGLTCESQVGGGSSLFNQFTGTYYNRLEIAASASDTAPVKATVSGMARVGILDASATLASVVTPAPNNDPFVFADASLTVNAGATGVQSGNFTIERAVDPLMLWNSRIPREFVPGEVSASGSIVVPYDTGAQSTILNGFTDAALVFNFGNNGNTVFRKFTFPKTKFVSLGRQINTRGGIMQEINWEAYYDPTSTTICTMTTE